MMKEVMTGTYIRGEETYNFNFYTDLTASDKVTFVNSVVDILVDDNYNSVIRDLIFNYILVKIFTDIDMRDIEESSTSIDMIESFLAESNVVSVVVSNINDGLIDNLNKAVDDAIEYRTGIHKNHLNDALASLVNTLEKKLNGINLEDMAEMTSKFIDMTDEFTTDNIVKAYLQTNMSNTK